MNCAFCRGVLHISGQVVRSDTCPHCKRDLRCCKQCKAYDPKAYNQCREVLAQRIVDKERGNVCERFALRGSPDRSAGGDKMKEARKALEALFKKK
jgi:hypothetical protein